jgi:alanyl-tRNA synthetase
MTIKTEYKIIADHLRSCCFLIADGIMPSNEGRGYVLRRIMRRAMLQIHKLGAKNIVMYKLVPALIKEMGSAYPELGEARDLIVDTLKNEEEKFKATLENGLKILEEELLKNPNSKEFSGAIAFKLYDTYGFPLDLTGDILKQHHQEVAIAEFDLEMQKQRQRGKENWVGSGEEKEDDYFLKLKEKFGETEFVGYETTYIKTKVLDYYVNDLTAFIILEKTPFYATSGGQKGDEGNIILASDIKDSEIKNFELIDYDKLKNVFYISETKKVAGLHLHVSRNNQQHHRGILKPGDEVIAIINNQNRQFRAQNHSATHLLHRALKELFGNQITQKGSNVDTAYFTFDFNFNRALSEEELSKIEDLVNFYIRQNSAVKTQIMSLETAKKQGAMALFGEKYSDQVRVLSMGKNQDNQDWSQELCGGTHVKNTGNIGLFKIISEKGIASGIRRIEAKTGHFAFEHLRLFQKESQILLEEKITEIKNKNQEINKLKKQILLSNIDDLNSEKIISKKGLEINLVDFCFKDINAQELREIMLEVKNRKQYQSQHVLVLFSSQDQKVAVIIAISSDLISSNAAKSGNIGYDARELIKIVGEKIGGKAGGGKEDFAMAGGNDVVGIANALGALKKVFGG